MVKIYYRKTNIIILKTQNDPVNNYEINFYRHTKLLIIKYTPTKNAVMRKITIQNTKNTPIFLSLKKLNYICLQFKS